MKRTIPHNHPEAGFSLVEFAIVMVIAGMLIGAAMTMTKPYLEMARRNATIKKQEHIAVILSEYALNIGRLPCPGRPNPPATETYGFPRNSGINGVDYYNPCDASYGATWTAALAPNYVGIIPFRALGLTEENVTDAWGNLMTYVVTPALAQDMTPGRTQMVHDHCRSISWTGGLTQGAGDILNRRKAMLCCSYDAAHEDAGAYQGTILSDMVVKDGRTGTAIFTNTHPDFSSFIYGGMDMDGADNGLDPSWPWKVWYGRTQLVAYAIISHGRNGDGAFVSGSAIQRPVTADPLAEESENRNNDLIVVDRPYSTVAGTGYFDDLILWRTNGQLVAETGVNTCARP